MIKDYFTLSYTFLKKRGLRSYLTMIGILIGIAAVISLIGLGEGLRQTVIGQFNFLSTDVLTIRAEGLHQGPPGTGVVNPLKEYYAEDIQRMNGVDTVIGRVIEDAKIHYNKHTDFTYAGSLPEGKNAKQEDFSMNGLTLLKGRMLQENEQDAVILGYHFTQPDHFGKPIELRDTVLVHDKKFEVAGFLNKKGSFIFDNIIMINENVMRDLFNVEDEYNLILARVDTIDDIEHVKERIENYLRKERNVDEGKEDFIVETQQQNLKDLDATLFAIQIFVYVIAGISIVVGGIGITNTMYTSVVERTRHIGIMKSIGATRTHIFTLFLIESGLLGLVGGIAGLALGVALAYTLAYAANILLNTGLITVSITPWLITGTLLFSYTIGSIAGILPALHASRLQPIQALRYAP